MQILFVAEGLDRCEAALLRGLAAQGHGVELHVGDAADVRVMKDTGVRAGYLPFRGRYDLVSIRAIRQRVRTGRFDIVHCLRNNRPLANALVAVRGAAVRLVAYRGTAGHLSRLDPGSWLTYLNPRIDTIVCVSEAVRRYLLRMGVPAGRAVTVYKGHDPAWYEGSPPADLSEFGIPGNACVVCCVANMRRDKGVDVLIRSLHHLPRDGSIHLLLVGSVQDARVLKAAGDGRIQHLVHFAGYREDATRLIGASHIFVMPSLRREGLPRAVIEAMCQRVPPIVTRVGGMPELVEDGQSGLVVDPSDPPAIARAVLRLSASPDMRRGIGEKARQRIESAFSITRTVLSTLRLYEALISR